MYVYLSMYVFWSVSFTIMQSLLVFCVIGLLFATDNGLVQGSISCTENCSIKEKDIQSSNPPLITEDRIAVLHSKCHSHCMNKLVENYSTRQSLDCTAIQSIESCQEGCLLAHNLYQKKMKGNHCINHCTSSCGDLNNNEWKKTYKSVTCPRQCKKDSCEIGCSAMKHMQKNAGNIHLALPTPDIRAIPKRNGRFVLKLTNRLIHRNKRDIRAAMVIRIKDEITNNTYYEWQPGLKGVLDLSYLACKEVSISFRLVFGNKVTDYSNPVLHCININSAVDIETKTREQIASRSCQKYTLQFATKIQAINEQADKLMKYVQSNSSTDDDSSTDEQLINMLNELKTIISS